jgi:hypothetical protein
MTEAQFTKMIQDGIKCRSTITFSKIGSAKADAADRRLAAMCDRAEAAGRLIEFCRSVNAPRLEA